MSAFRPSTGKTRLVLQACNQLHLMLKVRPLVLCRLETSGRAQVSVKELEKGHRKKVGELLKFPFRQRRPAGPT